MQSQPLAVVVLAAGLGKRMMSQRPKVLHPLAGRPLAAHVLRTIAPLSPSRTILVVGHSGDMVREALGDSYSFAGDGGQVLGVVDKNQHLTPNAQHLPIEYTT